MCGRPGNRQYPRMDTRWVLEWHDQSGFHTVPLGRRLTVGRAVGNDVVTGGAKMSRHRHLVVRPEGHFVSIDASHSANGLRIAGQPFKSARLHDGDTFAAGGVSFRIRSVDGGGRRIGRMEIEERRSHVRRSSWPAAAAVAALVGLGTFAAIVLVTTRNTGEAPSHSPAVLVEAVNNRDAGQTIAELGPGTASAVEIATAEELLRQMPAGSAVRPLGPTEIVPSPKDTRVEQTSFEVDHPDGTSTRVVVERWFVRHQGAWLEVTTLLGRSEP